MPLLVFLVFYKTLALLDNRLDIVVCRLDFDCPKFTKNALSACINLQFISSEITSPVFNCTNNYVKFLTSLEIIFDNYPKITHLSKITREIWEMPSGLILFEGKIPIYTSY